MVPDEVAAQVFGGYAAATAEEGLETLLPIVDGVDVEFAAPRQRSPASWSSASWVRPRALAQGGKTGGTVGDEQYIRLDRGFEARPDRSRPWCPAGRG